MSWTRQLLLTSLNVTNSASKITPASHLMFILVQILQYEFVSWTTKHGKRRRINLKGRKDLLIMDMLRSDPLFAYELSLFYKDVNLKKINAKQLTFRLKFYRVLRSSYEFADLRNWNIVYAWYFWRHFLLNIDLSYSTSLPVS